MVHRVRTVRGTEYVGTTYRTGWFPRFVLMTFLRELVRWSPVLAVFAWTLLVPLAVAAAVVCLT